MQPSELLPALRWYVASHDSDGMFGASLDHSPSEQLDTSAWHTTVLVLSRGMEHAELARAVASVANPLTGRLSKWSKSNKHYRKRFSEDFFRALNEHRVMVFAISAKGSSISRSEEHFVRELRSGRSLSSAILRPSRTCAHRPIFQCPNARGVGSGASTEPSYYGIFYCAFSKANSSNNVSCVKFHQRCAWPHD